MTLNSKNTSRLTKNDLMHDAPVCQFTTVCKQSYRSDISYEHLYSHDIPEISMVISGNGVHHILNKAFPCKEGDIYIINSDVPHGYFNADGSELVVRHLLFDVKYWFEGNIADPADPRFCYGVWGDSAITAYAMPSAYSKNIIEGLFESIEHELTEKKHEWREAIRAHLSLLLITVGRYVNGAVKNIITAKPKEWGVVSSAIRMISIYFSDCDLTLGSIADSLYVSKSHLSRLFKQLTGESFSEHLRRVRISHACTLLRETSMTVEDIVTKCGLKDIPTFYRTFNAIKKMTPNQYRTIHNLTEQDVADPEKTNEIYTEISTNLQNGKVAIIRQLIQRALDENCPPIDILNRGLLHGMNLVGEKFKNNEVYVPEVLIASRAMNLGMQILKPHLSEEGIKPIGRVCIGTVQGDLHDIGKNLVKMIMEGKGIEVIDLGTDVSPERFIQAAIEHDCKIICCSAILSTTMAVMADVVKKAEEAGIRKKVKIMIGGAPVNEYFCNEIGADCYTADAATAAETALRLLEELN